MSRPKELEVVALTRDFPEYRLRAGTAGTVVLVFDPDAVEVEFMDGNGDTVALLTLNDEDVRTVSGRELENLQHADKLPAGFDVFMGNATRVRR